MDGLIDKKDIKILETLKENSKLSTQQISRKTLIPVTTVHNRIKKMRDNGIIKKYTIKIDHNKLGRGVLVYVFLVPDFAVLKENRIRLQDLVEKIIKHPLVEEAATVCGFKDILLKARVSSIDELNKFVVEYLQKLNEVSSTETLVVLKAFE